MSITTTEDGKSWTEKKVGVPWIEGTGLNQKIFVVTDHIEQATLGYTGNWKSEYEAAAKKKALHALLAEDAKAGITQEQVTKLLLLVTKESVPHVSPRPGDPVKFLFSMGYLETGFVDTGDIDLEVTTWDVKDFDTVEFSSFIEFSRRMEVLALKYEEYEEKTISSGIVYFGPGEGYTSFIFKDEAESLRDVYEQVWESLKKNGVKAHDSFGIMFSAISSAEEVSSDEEKLKEEWFKDQYGQPVSIVGLFSGSPMDILAPPTFLPKGSLNDFSGSPFNDPRRLWVIRQIKDSTGDIQPFLDPSATLSLDAPPGQFPGFSSKDVKFLCESPAFAKGIPQFTHDEFVKKYLRPKPSPIPEGIASQGSGNKFAQFKAALFNWDEIGKDFTAVGTEGEFLKKNFTSDNILREAVGNRRTNISDYVGDYFMGQLPGRPKKIRSLHDAWRYFLSRMDLPTLIEEALECMYLDFSIDDIVDVLCDQMLEKLFKIDLEKLDKLASAMDTGEYSQHEIAGISSSDVAAIVRSAIGKAVSENAGKKLSETKLADETAIELAKALDDEFTSKGWRRFLCNVIVYSAGWMLGKGFGTTSDTIKKLKNPELNQEEKSPIPPYEKCDVTFKSLNEVPIVGTLYDMAMREAQKKIDEKIQQWIEEILVIPVRAAIWSWQKWCIEDEENKDHNYGGISLDDMPRSPNDDTKLKEQFFGDTFDFETFLRNLFGALTPREICGLMSGNKPSDKIARFVVQYVQTYPLAPEQLKNKVSDEAKIVSFFSSLSTYFDTSVCKNIGEYPENLITGPCDPQDLNYAEEAYREALKKLGLSPEDIDEQVEEKRKIILKDIADAVAKLSEDTTGLTEELEKAIKQTAQENFKNAIAGSGENDSPTGFSIILDTILDAVIASFKSDIEKFYQIIAANTPFFEQVYDKLLDLSKQRIIGTDISAPHAIYGKPLEHNVSKWHNYNLKVDTDVLSVVDGTAICEEIARQKALMKKIMGTADWELCPRPGEMAKLKADNAEPLPHWMYGEYVRIASAMNYKTFPPAVNWNDMTDAGWWFPYLGGAGLAGEVSTVKHNKYFHGWAESGMEVIPNMFDPAGMLQPPSPNYLLNFTQEELDDLFRIAFRYYARYTYNYNLGSTSANNTEWGWGNPKSESSILRPKSLPGNEDFDKVVFYGYSSFLMDPVDLKDEDVASYLDDVDFRCGHRGPGPTPTGHSSGNEYDNHLNWSELLSIMQTGRVYADIPPSLSAFTTNALGLPGAYLETGQTRHVLYMGPEGFPTENEADKYDLFIDSDKIMEELSWGIYGGTGWNLSSTKECLLRIFLFRFIGSDITGGTTNYTWNGGHREVGTYHARYTWLQDWQNGDPIRPVYFDPAPRAFGPTMLEGALPSEFYDEWDIDDYSNLIGGHMERALYYYEYGLDFHPGYSYFPYNISGQLNFIFSEKKNDSNFEGPFHSLTLDEFKFSELAEANWATPGFRYALGSGGLSSDLAEEVGEQQPVAQDTPYYGPIIHEDGPLEGQKVPLWQIMSKPEMVKMLECQAYEQSIAGQLDYEGLFNFGLLSQLDSEVTVIEDENSYCIIDRYGFISSFTTTKRYEERDRLIGVEVDLTIPEDAKDYTNDQAGRYKKIVDIFADTEIMGPDTIIPGPSLSQTIDKSYALQPQVFQKYLINKIKDGPVAMRDYGTPSTTGWEPESGKTIFHHLITKLAGGWAGSGDPPQGWNYDPVSPYNLYAILFRHVIKHISSLAYAQKNILKDFLENIDIAKMQFSLDSIKNKAIKDYQSLVDESDPWTGQNLPSIEDLMLAVDDEGRGGIAARVLIKILILEYFTRAVGMTVVFNLKDSMEDDIIMNFFTAEISNPVMQFYADQTTDPKVLFGLMFKLEKLIKTTLEEGMEDVINLFTSLYSIEGYDSAIDQVVLKNEQIYDLAKMYNELEVAEFTTGQQTPMNRLRISEDIISPFTTSDQISSLTYAEPRFSHPVVTSPDDQGWVTTWHTYENEGFILEKYIKIKFHPMNKMFSNLVDAGYTAEESTEMADKIFKLPIEYRGEMYFDDPGKPVYMNIEDFQEAFGIKAAGSLDGSIFDWKQTPGLGFPDDFADAIDELSKDSNWETLGYETQGAVAIQEELAFLEQLCTIAQIPAASMAQGSIPGIVTMDWADLSVTNIAFAPDDYMLGVGVEEETYYLLNQMSTGDPRFIDTGQDKLGQTRPHAYKYLEHLNGGQVYYNGGVSEKDGYMRSCLEKGALTKPQYWSGRAYLPLFSQDVFSFISEEHRTLLTNIAFRYYTMKYFGDYTGFKIRNPWELAGTSKGREILSIIFHGDRVSVPALINGTATSFDNSSLEVGEFYGEAKGIAEMMFPKRHKGGNWSLTVGKNEEGTRDLDRFDLAKTSKAGSDTKWEHAGMWFEDPIAKVPNIFQSFLRASDPAGNVLGPPAGTGSPDYYTPIEKDVFLPLWTFDYDTDSTCSITMGSPIWTRTTTTQLPPDVAPFLGEDYAWSLIEPQATLFQQTVGPMFQTQEEFERYMLFGLFFGFDAGSDNNWRMLKNQSTNGADVFEFGQNPFFQNWTTSYQRDLYLAMKLYKNGMPEIGLTTSPIDIFTNGVLITDTLQFAQEVSGESWGSQMSTFAEEAAYGVRLSCLLPRNIQPANATLVGETGEFWERPLSKNKQNNDQNESFYDFVSHSTYGVTPGYTESLLTIKRLKAYAIREMIRLNSNPEAESPMYMDGTTPGMLTFLLPLLEEEHDVTNSTTLLSLLSDNWYEKTNWKQDDRTNDLSLYNEMKKRKEFRLLFDYIFPVKRMLSLVTIHNFLSLSGIISQSAGAAEPKDVFAATKKLLSDLSLSNKS